MKAQMAYFDTKIRVSGTFDHQKLICSLSNVLILIQHIKSFYLMPNASFKNVALPLYEPKKGQTNSGSNHKEVSFWPFYHFMFVLF